MFETRDKTKDHNGQLSKMKNAKYEFNGKLSSEQENDEIVFYNYSWIDVLDFNGKKILGDYKDVDLWYFKNYQLLIVFTHQQSVVSHVVTQFNIESNFVIKPIKLDFKTIVKAQNINMKRVILKDKIYQYSELEVEDNNFNEDLLEEAVGISLSILENGKQLTVFRNAYTKFDLESDPENIKKISKILFQYRCKNL
ncbi:hypothetical protein [Salipaludibacillus aurantiacus]|nr:hypothetical protein [Salipaludibacillus aurantiacus]